MFVEWYLDPAQTFIFRQMNELSGCSVQFACRYRVPQHPYLYPGAERENRPLGGR